MIKLFYRHRHPRLERLLPQVPERACRSTASTSPCSSATSPARSSCRSSRRAGTSGNAPSWAVPRDQRRAGARRHQEDHRERGLLLGPPDARGVRGHARPTRPRSTRSSRASCFTARAGVARPRRRASRGQAVTRCTWPGQRRLVRDRRHDRQRQARASLRQPRRRDRRSRDDHRRRRPTRRRGTRRAR